MRSILISRYVLAFAALAAHAAGHAQVNASVLPEQIRIVVPFSPGASNDLFARALGQRLSTKYPKVTVIVDNKPGAGGAIGADFVARAKPDGATILLTSSSFSTNAAVQKSLPYDPITSFSPVALLARGPMVMVVATSSPYKTLPDYLKAARADSKMNFGSAGIGSIGHMGGELFNTLAQAKGTHIPYKGISNATSDMLGGNLQMMITTAASVNGPLKAGLMRPLAVTSTQRSRFTPELPPIADQVPGYSLDVWWIVMAPANTPRPIVEALNMAIRDWGDQPETRELFARESTEPTQLSPAETGTYLANEVNKWRKLARDRNISLD